MISVEGYLRVWEMLKICKVHNRCGENMGNPTLMKKLINIELRGQLKDKVITKEQFEKEIEK